MKLTVSTYADVANNIIMQVQVNPEPTSFTIQKVDS